MAGKKTRERQSNNTDKEQELTAAQPCLENIQVIAGNSTQKRATSSKLNPALQKQYMKELNELVSVFPALDFLKKKVTELQLKFDLKELTASYRLIINTFRDSLEKHEVEIRELKREQEKFKIRTKLLMEELMLPVKGSKTPEKSMQLIETVKETQNNKEVIEELERNYQRLKMDFDNFKRRSNLQIEQLTKTANERLILKMLPVLDNFNLALSSMPAGNNNEAYRQGVLLIKRQVEELLEKEGLTPIESNGVLFNPKFHEAFMHEETNGVPEDTVLEELRKGYCLGEKVIRPSLVKVAKTFESYSGESINEQSNNPQNGGNEAI